MDSETRKRLTKQRGLIKGRITKIKHFLDAYTENVSIHNLRIRQEMALKAWEEYNVIQEKLLLEDEDETHVENHQADLDNFIETYCTIMTTLQDILEPVQEIRNSSRPNSSVSSQARSSVERQVQIKLPTIKIPTFAGNVIHFRHFHDTFNSLIIANQSLDNIQRYHYLLSSLQAEAHKLIENIPVTNENFEVAWQLICNRYNDPKLIAITHTKALLNLSSVNKECPEALRALLNQVKSNVNALNALNLNVPLHDLIIAQLCLEKVDSNTSKNWELKHESQ